MMLTDYSSLVGGPYLPHWKVVGLAFAYSILQWPQFSNVSNLTKTLPGMVPESVTSRWLSVQLQ